MDRCDVAIIGGGPAGSSCAWELVRRGLRVVVLDRQKFPRDKVCAGWITPLVIDELRIDPRDYARGRVFQPITAFRTGVIGGGEISSNYGRVVSYGIRRCEFDHYLVMRSGAGVIAGGLQSLERENGQWIINKSLRASALVGAGGHFCPVARHLGARQDGEPVVAAKEIEFAMSPVQAQQCSVRPEAPELFFCRDMKGYGWCFRKGDFLNLGLGRVAQHGLNTHIGEFVEWLKACGKAPLDLPSAWRGHAYLLYEATGRRVLDDGVLLIGDSAGLAYAQSGEGIRPAIESGLIAAQVIAEAAGDYSRAKLAPYEQRLRERFGSEPQTSALGRLMPGSIVAAAGRLLLRTTWFSRSVVLDQWFLRLGSDAPIGGSEATVGEVLTTASA
ncbi:MAG TPA: NAD(P)/FAD-dependent oxidoreductase [Terriglobales bacterium]|nr:NAD(P)/FAD-dependent oxidoreductase [Terriglobales bacterium]